MIKTITKTLYRVSHKKYIDKKNFQSELLTASIQFLNLFGFSISVSFVWCSYPTLKLGNKTAKTNLEKAQLFAESVERNVGH